MSEMVELGLQKPGKNEGGPDTDPRAAVAGDLKGLIGRLLRIMAGSALEAEQNENQDWQSTLESLNDQLFEAAHRQEVLLVASAALKALQQRLGHSSRYYSGRERELTELIEILREGVESALGTRNKAFHADVMSSANSFNALHRIENVRELKAELAKEVGRLRDITSRKQEEDARAFEELTERVNELEHDLRLANEEASVDALTGVWNRRAFDRAIARLMSTAAAHKPLTLSVIDVNEFKQINDTYGHPVGDSCLKYTAQALTTAFRSEDVVARVGGDEFAVLLPGMNLKQAQERVGTLLADLSRREYEYDAQDGTKKLRFSLSGGIAQYHPDESKGDFMKRADDALYDAKRGGPGTVAVRKRSRLANLLRG